MNGTTAPAQADLAALLAELATRFINLDPQEVDTGIRLALAEIGRRSGVDRCYVFLISEDGATFSNTHEWCREGVPPQLQDLQNLPTGAFAAEIASLARDEVLHIPKVAALPPGATLRETLEAGGVRSILNVPMAWGNKLRGLIGFDAVRAARRWSAPEIALLRTFAALFAAALERRARDLRLQRSEADLNEAQRIARLGSWDWDIARGELHWSAEVYRIFGLDPRDFHPSYVAYLGRIHPADRERVRQGVELALTEDRPYSIDHRVVRPDGSLRTVHERAEVIRGAEGRPRRVFGTVQDISEREQTRAALAEELERNRMILRTTLDGYILADVDGRVLDVNPAYCEIVAYTRDELLSMRIQDLEAELDEDQIAQLVDGMLANGQARFETRHRRKEGDPVDLDVSISVMHAAERPLIAAFVRDISERLRAEQRLRQAATVFESTSEGVYITDAEGHILDTNRAFTRITGYSTREVLGKNPRHWQSGIHGDAFYHAMWESIRQRGQWQGEIWNRRRNGHLYPQWLTISAVRDEQGRRSHYVAVFSDITELKRSQADLERLATHDSLTGLPNRVLFNDRLAHALNHAKRAGGQLAVLFLDLDQFKNVNDSLGHATGDLLLQHVAERLAGHVRRDDTVARIGGDEFVVLMEELAQPDDAAVVAEALMRGLADPFRLEEHEVYVGVSIGISLYPRDGDAAETLLKNADAAMYRAKEQGRNNYQFYTQELTASAFRRVLLDTQLRRALERDELEVFYQPQTRLDDGRAIGAEALLRWRHPDMGLVSPARFIPQAEESGLIVPMGEWVLERACRQLLAWRAADLPLEHIAVNLSGPQIQRGDLVGTVRRVLDSTGLPPARLELELTEDLVMGPRERAVQVLCRLRELGVSLAIDDFGTGYSSLAYLKRLPINKLKIDQGFVRDIPGDPNDQAIARAIVALGNSLQLMVIAEGVETEEQREFLLAEGCEQAQGFLYSPPLPPEELEAWLRGRTDRG